MKAVFVIQAPDQVRAHWQRVTEMLRKRQAGKRWRPLQWCKSPGTPTPA